MFRIGGSLRLRAQQYMKWALLTLSCSLANPVWSSYAIYVGKNLTADGSVMMGGSGDEVSSHWLEVVPAQTFPDGSVITVGVNERAFMPGQFTTIPQVARTARYLTMNYSEYEGFPPPLTNGGLNEHNVAARDVWSPSRPELVAMTPNPANRTAVQRSLTNRDGARADRSRSG